MPVTVDAVEDRSLLGAIDMFQSAGPALGDVVVLDLGYNDSSDPTVFRERIDGAMAALAGVKHVIWLNQHEFRPGPGRDERGARPPPRRGTPTSRSSTGTRRWSAHPEDVYGDSIHLTPAGQAAMAALVRQHFDRFVTSLTPTTTAAPATTTPSVSTPRAGVAAGRRRQRGRRLGHRPGHGPRGRGGGRGRRARRGHGGRPSAS